MSKETIKRDKNGRFAKKAGKVEVEVHVEPKPEKDLLDLICISKGEYEQLKLERDAFKSTSEKVSSLYLNKCEEFASVSGERREFANRLMQKDAELFFIHAKLLSIIDSLPFYRFSLRKKLKELHSKIYSAFHI